MTRIWRRTPSPFAGFPFLSVAFVLVAAASFLLADGGLAGLFSATIFDTPRGFLILAIGPFALVAFSAILFHSVVSHILHEGYSSRFGRALFAAFAFLAVAATVPVAVTVTRFVDTALSSWFDSEVGESLESGAVMAELYRAERLRDIERVASRYLNALAISAYRARPAEAMNDIRLVDAYVVAYQVYLVERGDDGALSAKPVVETGDSSLFFPRSAAPSVRDGFLGDVEGDGEGEGVYRYGRIVRYGGNEYACVYSSLVAEGFAERLEAIRLSGARARTIETLKPYLPLMGVWIYFLFCLPTTLIALALAWYASYRLSFGVSAASEAASRLAKGDRSVRLVSRGNDDIASLSRSLNETARSAKPPEDGKKGDKRAVFRI